MCELRTLITVIACALITLGLLFLPKAVYIWRNPLAPGARGKAAGESAAAGDGGDVASKPTGGNARVGAVRARGAGGGKAAKSAATTDDGDSETDVATAVKSGASATSVSVDVGEEHAPTQRRITTAIMMSKRRCSLSWSVYWNGLQPVGRPS